MTSPWVTTKELTDYLRMSKKTLYQHKPDLSYGIHYRKLNPKVSGSKVLWHLKRIEDHFCRPITPVN